MSIDGGGYRGVFAAHLLKRMEEEWGLQWTRRFAILAGTSTGSILAAGLVLGLSARELALFYENHGASIFRPRRGVRSSLLRSRYSSESLRAVLRDIFKEAKLGQIVHPLILPAVDIGNGCVHVFKSSYVPGFVRDREVLVSDAVLASCSAPTYFDPLELGTTYRLADGGLWANNPALVAVIDAHFRLHVPFDDVRVLSIGTGKASAYYPQPALRWTDRIARRIGWGLATGWERARLIDLILNLQADNAHNMTCLLLGNSNVCRLTFTSDRPLPMDSTGKHDDWITKADHCFTHYAQTIRSFLRLEEE